MVIDATGFSKTAEEFLDSPSEAAKARVILAMNLILQLMSEAEKNAQKELVVKELPFYPVSGKLNANGVLWPDSCYDELFNLLAARVADESLVVALLPEYEAAQHAPELPNILGRVLGISRSENGEPGMAKIEFSGNLGWMHQQIQALGVVSVARMNTIDGQLAVAEVAGIYYLHPVKPITILEHQRLNRPAPTIETPVAESEGELADEDIQDPATEATETESEELADEDIQDPETPATGA